MELSELVVSRQDLSSKGIQVLVVRFLRWIQPVVIHNPSVDGTPALKSFAMVS